MLTTFPTQTNILVMFVALQEPFQGSFPSWAAFQPCARHQLSRPLFFGLGALTALLINIAHGAWRGSRCSAQMELEEKELGP